ncbi:MAG: Fe-S cluster assembly protein SufD [Bdellovibrionota bacterium]
MNFDQLAPVAERRLKLDEGRESSFRKPYLQKLSIEGLTNTLSGDIYKFTNMKSFLEKLSYEPKNNPVDLESFIDDRLPTLFFIDGDLQNPELKIDGLTTELYKGKPEDGPTHALTNLHHGLMSDGVKITVKKNTKITSPVRILHLLSRAGVVAPTVIVEAETHSEFTLIEENIALDTAYALTSETHVHARPGSRVEHIHLEKGKAETIHHGATYAHLEKDATYRNFVFHISGHLNRRNVFLNMKAPGSHGESFNLYLTNETEQSDIYTELHHLSADTTSDQLAKGILDGSSKAVFTGKIHIHPDAQRVNAGQLNKNLLLSKKAQVHSQPQLEIFADDVKCSHGSTTGQLSPDEVFYFESRGIPLEKAKTLLAHGFGLEVVLKIQNPVARELTSSLVLETLKTKFNLGGKS